MRTYAFRHVSIIFKQNNDLGKFAPNVSFVIKKSVKTNNECLTADYQFW